MVNRFAQRCCFCRATVPAGAGRCWKHGRRWYAAHLVCDAERRAAREEGREPRYSPPSEPAVTTFVIGGREFIQNRNGRCIDAPCCGCCTI